MIKEHYREILYLVDGSSEIHITDITVVPFFGGHLTKPRLTI